MHISYTHIYREQNQIVDLISKRGIDSRSGKYHFAAFAQGKVMNAGSININYNLSRGQSNMTIRKIRENDSLR